MLSHFSPDNHVPLRRIWASAKLEAELTLPEHIHILDCDRCRPALKAALRVKTFVALLQELERQEGG